MKAVFIGFVLWCSIQLVSAKPHILFIHSDDILHAICYGYQFASTPYFDSLAKNGLRFTRGYTPSSKYALSRAVILTGRNPWQQEGAANYKPAWPDHRSVRDGSWKLYDRNEDRTELNNLSNQYPERVSELAVQWKTWATRTGVKF